MCKSWDRACTGGQKGFACRLRPTRQPVYQLREYWALTNEHGQLVYVLADNIILQDDSTEPVNSDGRYYDDEADVSGTEHEDLDQGHVIAGSLGGVANAYNITPQNSVLNRHGDQAYKEKVIREPAAVLILSQQ